MFPSAAGYPDPNLLEPKVDISDFSKKSNALKAPQCLHSIVICTLNWDRKYLKYEKMTFDHEIGGKSINLYSKLLKDYIPEFIKVPRMSKWEPTIL